MQSGLHVPHAPVFLSVPKSQASFGVTNPSPQTGVQTLRVDVKAESVKV